MRAPYRIRVARSRPIWSVPSQWAALIETNRSRRFVSAKPYGVSTEARTAASSITRTRAPPMVPSGLRRSIVIQTSAYHGSDRGSRRTSTSIVGRGTGVTDMALPVPDPRIEERVGQIDDQVEPDDHRRHDQVHRLHHRVVQTRQRFEEEQAHAGETKDRLDDDGSPDIERRLQADQAHHGDQRVLERVAEHDRALGQAFRPGGTDVVLAEHLERSEEHTS